MSEAEIQISVRIRPLLNSQAESSAVDIDNKTGAVTTSTGESFKYPSHVVKGSDQVVAFEALAAKLIERARKGYNCTLMVYGQTGSGKTHTMFGPPGCLTETSVQQAGVSAIPETWGLFPRAVLTMMQDGDGASLHASAIEVYHELVFDLLEDRSPLQIGSSKPLGMKVGGNPDRGGSEAQARGAHGVHPASCTCFKCFQAQEAAKKARPGPPRRANSAPAVDTSEQSFATVGEKLTPLKSAEDVARFARTVEATRTARGHLLNDRSSRSHCLVKVHVSRTDPNTNRKSRVMLLFVDLAGSERLNRTQAEGDAKMEAQSINSSLSALGRVIKALGLQSKGTSSHIPYRDAPLTMLLRDSFGGKSCTSVVINVAAEAEHLDESACSLRFGERMGLVRNSPCVVVDTSSADAGMLGKQLDQVREELAKMTMEGLGGGFVPGAPTSEVNSLKDNMNKLAESERQVQQIIVQITEAKSAAPSKGTVDNVVGPLKQKLRVVSEQAEIFRGVVERQQTIKTLWSLPTPGFKRKAAEVKELEGRLTLLL